MNDSRHHAVARSVVSGDRADPFSGGEHCSHVYYLPSAEFCLRVTLPAPLELTTSPFGLAIPSIVEMGTKEQVIDPDARRVVAFVQHTKIGRDAADKKFPGAAMRCTNVVPDTEVSVALSVTSAGPDPTGGRATLVDVAPETLLVGRAHLGQGRRSRSRSVDPCLVGLGSDEHVFRAHTQPNAACVDNHHPWRDRTECEFIRKAVRISRREHASAACSAGRPKPAIPALVDLLPKPAYSDFVHRVTSVEPAPGRFNAAGALLFCSTNNAQVAP